MIAHEIAELAEKEAKKSGEAILYMTAWDIAYALGHRDAQMIRLALRLSYTREFFDEYGFSFLPPGCGRSGAIYGYALLFDKKGATEQAYATLNDGNVKRADHLAAVAAHYAHLARVEGKNTRHGRRCDWLAKQLDAAVATAQQVEEESQELLTSTP
jgi:hypothetical protein